VSFLFVTAITYQEIKVKARNFGSGFRIHTGHNKVSCIGLGRPRQLQEVEVSSIFRQLVYESGKFDSPAHRPSLPRKWGGGEEISGTCFC
jgi:hypothetical protein